MSNRLAREDTEDSMNGSPQNQRKIEVKSGQLTNLIADVASGRYRIPQFQREYVWPKTKVRELFDSIYQEFPIGSFFLWDAGRGHNHLFREIVDLGVPPVEEHDSVSFILDGQQRITSLFVTLKGLTVSGTDYKSIVFDLKEEKFKDRKPDNNRYVSVSDMWGANSMMLSREIAPEYVNAYDRCWKTLQTYPVSLVEVRDKDLPAVCKIFQRINQSGKRLDRFDLISAMTFTTDFDLREKFKADVIAPLEHKLFGAINPAAVTQLLALIKHGQCTERYEFDLTSDFIKENWKRTVDSILLAADTLRSNMGVINAKYLPYAPTLALLAYYFFRSGNRSAPAEHLEWLRAWFWKSSFGQYYGSAGPTKMGRDKELFDDLINGGSPSFDVPVHITPADLAGTKMTWTGSATRNAFLCLLAIQRPRHFENNAELDLVANISDFSSNEKHHIFPKAFLDRQGLTEAEIHAAPNFCFLTAELNKRILDSEPAIYFKELEAKNPEFERAARTNLLPYGPDSGIAENDFQKFMLARAMVILEEIGRLCGEITTPRVEERQLAVERLELSIRDLIHEVLSQNVGENYWKTNIPGEIRDAVDQRIAADIKRHPDTPSSIASNIRSRLDYLLVSDYKLIIANGANWSYFETTFSRKQDFMKYLDEFGRYRNALMHNRDLTELARMSGETAILWFKTVFGSNQETDTDEDMSS